MRVVRRKDESDAFVTNPEATQAILEHLGLPSRAPAARTARSPPEHRGDRDQLELEQKDETSIEQATWIDRDPAEARGPAKWGRPRL